MKVKLLLFSTSICLLINAELKCPNNTSSYDMEVCDPTRRSQCPSGFTCRKSFNTENQLNRFHICCETQPMTIEDWFFETELTPKILSQPPKSMLSSVEMAPLDSITALPGVRIGDEVIILEYPQYKTAHIQSVIFTTPPPIGGFLHVMTLIGDPLLNPFALFFTYNLPSTGGIRLPIPNKLQGLTGRAIYIDNSTIVMKRNSYPLLNPFALFFTYNLPSTGGIRLPIPNKLQGLTGRAIYIDNSTIVMKRNSYRSQYVVLTYRTSTPITIGNRQNINSPFDDITIGLTLMGECRDVECLLKTTTFSKQLGIPISGSIFYLTTKDTIFEKNRGCEDTSASSFTVLTETIMITIISFVFLL
ncbi:hypothetical protein DICVIV_11913 [Dictyocaulus viviparus]|uniref:Uncharacterized protein n=1 Tax=Dictyocaulus viviparus TaxID=29172 RepID=A0A0D8XEK9_DICVI|nr:hypothetical protein DICVIV_11913 [Dictyocaulus viviparus]